MTRTEMLLTILAEECNETAQRVSKAIRFGLGEIQEGQTLTNAERIIYEFSDTLAVMEILVKEGSLSTLFDNKVIISKKEKIEKYLNYSEEVGTLTKPTLKSIKDKLELLDKQKAHLCWNCQEPHQLTDKDAGGDRELERLCIECFDKKSRGHQSLTTDRNDPDLHIKSKSGQNMKYLILSEEERAKGFVRPLRRSYVHVGTKPNLEEGTIRKLTDEEKIMCAGENYVAFLQYKKNRGHVVGLFLKDGYDKSNGCGGVTVMRLELCQTYACDPKFYSSTYCAHCKTHLPVSEFIWDEDKEVMGS